jgi:molybdopterin synthase sulfur carrier subunit
MIQILCFAQFQEIVGQKSIFWHETPITAAVLKEKLQQQYGLPDLDHTMIAVNEEYADDDMEIKDGDTVALIPPVSGG